MFGRLIAAAVILGIAAGGAHHFLANSIALPAVRPQLPVPQEIGRDRIFLNAGQQTASLDALPGAPIKSLIKVDRRMSYGDFVWRDHGVPSGSVWVRVDLKSQILSVFRAGHEIGTAVILYGATEKQTPTGVFPILAKLKDHQSSTYDARMPYTLRLTGDGVSIHGSDVRWGAATHGCIGVPVEFARLLFDQVSTGSRVLILSGSPARHSLAQKVGQSAT